MAHTRPDIDYINELCSIRKAYVSSAPRQRLAIIRERLNEPTFGANRLVACVSAVEAFARSLAMHRNATCKDDLADLYRRFKDSDPKALVVEGLPDSKRSNPAALFGEDNWQLFSFAVSYRNLIVHECTMLGQDKFPSLIAACEAVLEKLVEISGE